jgi:mannose-6-phosphate isomerase-like protein (cupin superfamily)
MTRTADFPSLGNRYLIESSDTDGRFALIEHTIAPRTLAAPMHVHEHEDEYSFVLQGRMGAQIGDDVVEAGPGELVFKPRGIPHAFWNPGDEETRLLELISPGEFANYFTELAPLINDLGDPAEADFSPLVAVMDRYSLSMNFESVGPLMERHGLQA